MGESTSGREAIWAYFRSGVGSAEEKKLAKTVDAIIETDRPAPKRRTNAPKPRSPRTPRAPKIDPNIAKTRWRNENPEKITESRRLWREKNGSDWSRRWRAANPEKVKESQRKWKAKRARELAS